MSQKAWIRIAVGALIALGALATATAQMPNPYGMPISLETAKKVAAPAIAEAAKNNWAMAVAIVDPAGNLVYYEKMDNTQLGSANVAIDKARSATLRSVISNATPTTPVMAPSGARRGFTAACSSRPWLSASKEPGSPASASRWA